MVICCELFDSDSSDESFGPEIVVLVVVDDVFEQMSDCSVSSKSGSIFNDWSFFVKKFSFFSAFFISLVSCLS